MDIKDMNEDIKDLNKDIKGLKVGMYDLNVDINDLNKDIKDLKEIPRIRPPVYIKRFPAYMIFYWRGKSPKYNNLSFIHA